MRARALRSTSPDAERVLWNHLRDRRLDGHKFRRQQPIESYFADFACVESKLVVEIDGGQHFEPDAIEADRRRSAALASRGWHVLRFSNHEVLAERDGVLAAILDWLHTHHPHPSPLPQAGEGASPRTTP